MGWSNKNVDKDLDALDLEFNAAKRVTIVHDLLKYYTAEVPVLPLYYRSDISVTPKNLKNYKMAGHQFYETNNVEEWTLN
jgi:peptide/nickel transport system substrate-binding protein